MSQNNVTSETHEAVTAELPPWPDAHRFRKEPEVDEGFRRKDVPPPSIWTQSLVVSEQGTGRRAVVAALDLATRQWRGYFPATDEWDSRLEWRSFDGWVPEVRFNASELEKQAASTAIGDELETMDAKELGLVKVLADGDDPRKVLGKIQALRAAGMIRPRPDVPVTESKAKGK